MDTTAGQTGVTTGETGEKTGVTTGETGETTAGTAADPDPAPPYAGHALCAGLERDHAESPEMGWDRTTREEPA